MYGRSVYACTDLYGPIRPYTRGENQVGLGIKIYKKKKSGCIVSTSMSKFLSGTLPIKKKSEVEYSANASGTDTFNKKGVDVCVCMHFYA